MKRKSLSVGILLLLGFAVSVYLFLSSDQFNRGGAVQANSPRETISDAIPQEMRKVLYTGTAQPLSEKHEQYYKEIIYDLLEQNLWTARDVYDAAHYLMLPMYYAFFSGDGETVSLFSEFFHRFTQRIQVDAFYEAGELNNLQFFYFATQFINLCAANDRSDLIPEELPRLAETYAEDYLLRHVANWSTEPTVLAHLQQVLAGKEYPYSYYSCIEDLDGYTLAILCDLNCYARLSGNEPSEAMILAADLTKHIYASPLLNRETEGGGWLFQAGVWADHPDFAYAGNEKVTADIQPCKREDIPWDSSHFSRWAPWLNSYQSAQSDESGYALLETRKQQLVNQLVDHVFQNVDGKWLATTFMDGTNGVYRYSYNIEGVGLEGYALSGTILIGWWSCLRDARITAIYQDILGAFPMAPDCSNPYFDYATVREQNPYFDNATAYTTGMFELIVACAAGIVAEK